MVSGVDSLGKGRFMLVCPCLFTSVKRPCKTAYAPIIQVLTTNTPLVDTNFDSSREQAADCMWWWVEVARWCWRLICSIARIVNAGDSRSVVDLGVPSQASDSRVETRALLSSGNLWYLLRYRRTTIAPLFCPWTVALHSRTSDFLFLHQGARVPLPTSMCQLAISCRPRSVRSNTGITRPVCNSRP